MNSPIVLQVALAALVCMSGSTVITRQDSGSQWLDDKQLLTIEVPIADDLIENVRNTAFLNHPRCSELIALLTHETFGLWTERQWETWLELIEQIESDLLPTNIVFSMPVSSAQTGDWQVIIRSASRDVGLEWTRTKQLLAQMTMDELAFEEFQKSAAEREVFVENEIWSSKVEYPKLKTGVFSFFSGDWIVVASSQDIAKTTLDRMTGDYVTFRPLASSRIYQSLTSELQISGKGGTSLVVHLNPRLIWALWSGKVDETELRQWGIHELVGLGLSLNIMESKTKKDATEFVISTFVRTTIPRTGIAKAIILKRMPAEFPPLPENSILFGMANFDLQHFVAEFEKMYDQVHGDGSHLARWLETSEVNRKLGEEHRLAWRASMGNCRFYTWVPDGEAWENTAFFEMRNAEQMIQCLLDMTSAGADIIEDFGYVEDEIDGHRATLTPKKVGQPRYGSVYLGKWQIHGDEEFLEHVTQMVPSESLPANVDQMLQIAREQTRFDTDVSIVGAFWPQAWEAINSTVANEFIVRHFRERFKIEKPQGVDEFNRFHAQAEKSRQQWRKFVFSEPKSKRETRRLAEILVLKIVTDSLGRMILMGGDNGHGFKAVAMTFPSVSDAER